MLLEESLPRAPVLERRPPEASPLKEKLLALAELQNVDLELAALKKSHSIFPKNLAELEKELEVSRSAVQSKRDHVADLERQRHEKEHTISDEKDKVKKWEARLAEQRSTREYSALAREIDIAKKANLNMSEELVELTRELAAGREELNGAERAFATQQADIQKRMEELKGQMEEARGQAVQLEQKRAAATKGVDANLLRRYESIRKKRLPVLVPLDDATCTGCNMRVPPQLANNLRSSRGTEICPNCRRMIYQPEALESSNATEAG